MGGKLFAAGVIGWVVFAMGSASAGGFDPCHRHVKPDGSKTWNYVTCHENRRIDQVIKRFERKGKRYVKKSPRLVEGHRKAQSKR